MKINNRQICVISGIFPRLIYNEIIENSKYNTQHAADKLQKSLLGGLFHHDPNIYVINLPFVGSYPKRYKKLLIPYTRLDHINGESLSFINLSGFKIIFKKYKLYKTAQKWIKQNEDEKVLIVYSLQSYLIDVLDKLKKKHPDIKIIFFIPDLVQFMGGPSGFFYRIKRQRDIKFINSKLHIADAYILLTDKMINKLPDKPYIVIEGMVSKSVEHFKVERMSKKTIFYSGSLDRRYGIMNLIKSYQLLGIDNTQLIVCGSGDCENEIKEISEKNPDIIFKGSLKHFEVVELQLSSHLLINPRTPEGEYTEYSFPSKTMEYFQSGTPVLMYRLPGIPNEYFDYCFTIENDYSINKLASKIQEILSMKQEELETKGKRAKEFIENNKNSITQTSKIFKLINNI